MMLLAFEFVSPWLLLGLLAAGIPPVLHLLASVRAREMPFPTLRFLRISMQRTSRRRKIQHWLLMAIRSILLGLLAMGVAQLVVDKSTAAWGQDEYAAVLILDNSYSMTVADGDGTRLGHGKAQALGLLNGSGKPAAAQVLLTNGGGLPGRLTPDLEPLRTRVNQAAATGGVAAISQRVGEAVELLANSPLQDKRLYVFSDLQAASFAELRELPELRDNPDVRLLMVSTANTPAENVGIVGLDIAGRRVADKTLAFTVTLLNSGRADRPVTATLTIDGTIVARSQRVTCKGVDKAGAGPVSVKLRHPFAAPGDYSGQVHIEIDDALAVDNQRAFSLKIGGRARALVISGLPDRQAHLDGGRVLQYALDPRDESVNRWSLRPVRVSAAEFTAADLGGVDAVFCANVPTFSPEQAKALGEFVKAGGVLTFFMGNEVVASDYNDLFVDGVDSGGLLPARLVGAVGKVGLRAPAVALDYVDFEHAYFSGLLTQPGEHRRILTQRHFRVEPAGGYPPKVLMRLVGGDPLLLARPFGAGRVILCTTTASLQWTKLPSVGLSLFVPMLERITLQAHRGQGADNTFPQNATVEVHVPVDVGESDAIASALAVTLPSGDAGDVPAAIRQTPDGPTARFAETSQLGVYRWQLTGPITRGDPPSGTFAINADGREFDLATVPAADLRGTLGADRCFVAPTIAAAHKSAAGKAAGVNLSDLFLIGVILLLITEAVIANRHRDAAPGSKDPSAGRMTSSTGC